MADVKEIADLIGKEIAGTGQLNKRDQEKLVAAIRRLALDAFAINRIVNYSGGSAGGGYTELNRIRRYPYDGGDVVLYPINRGGLLQAFAECANSDTITIPPATLPGDFTIPASTSVLGSGSKSTIFSGQITGASGAYLRDCSITRTDNSSSNLIGLVTPASGTLAINTVAITITQSGSGAAYALSASGGGDIKVRGCYLFASSGSGSGYAVLRSSGNVYLEEGCELSGSTSKTSGSNIYDLSFDPEIFLQDSAGAFKGVFSFTAAGLTAALAAATSGDVVQLPAGTLSGNNTVPAGVTLAGMDRRKTILSGQITLGNGSVLVNLGVTRTANDANALYGALGPATGGTAYILNSDITCTQSGSGTAAGLALQGGNVYTWLWDLSPARTRGSGYGVTNIGTSGASQTTRSYDISGIAVDSTDETNGHIDNETTPITGSGGDCASEGTSCHIHSTGGNVWIIYDLGGVWTNISQLSSRDLHDGDLWIHISTNKSDWTQIYYQRMTWAGATCSTYNTNPAGNPSARYIRYQVDDIVVVGDHTNLAWFELTGTPTAYGTGTYYYTRFSGNTKDLDGTNGTANVYACQYQTYNGTPVQMWGDRSAWDTTNYW